MKNINMGTAVALGTGIGAALGIALDNIAVWVAIGAGVGIAIGAAVANRPRDENEE